MGFKKYSAYISSSSCDLSCDYHMLCSRPHQVNFSVKDGVPQDEYKAVLRHSGGSMEVLTNGDDTTKHSYRSVSC